MSAILTQHFWASPELRIPRIQMTYQATVPKLHLGMFCLSIGLSDRLATLTNIQESSIKSSGSWLLGNFGQNKLSSDISSRCLNEPTNEKRGPCLAATKKNRKKCQPLAYDQRMYFIILFRVEGWAWRYLHPGRPRF